MKRKILLTVAIAMFTAAGAQENVFRRGTAHASSSRHGYPAVNAIDGTVARTSRWISASGVRPPHTLEVELPFYADVDSLVIHTGIPADEKKPAEQSQSSGFWNVKNFVLQYWDDANWTDIPGTLTTENRLDRVSFRFPSAVTSSRFRMSSTDGEAIRISEFEGWGRENKKMGVPAAALRHEEDMRAPESISVKVMPAPAATTMQYVGYNQGYYLPGGNTSGWLEYSNVNSVRLWAALDDYVPRKWVSAGDGITGPDEFDSRKDALRADPPASGFIAWDSIAAVCGRVVPATNTMVMDYALTELERLGIEVILQMGMKFKDLSWRGKWEVWQRYYALAYHCARKGGVGMFAMQNEPNHRHAGPVPLDVWIDMMRVVSDAVHCAVEDANKACGRSITPRFVGPVTAGTNTDWWARIAAAERVDYRGRTLDRDLIEIFSTHSYNLPAAGYDNKVQGIDAILREHHPEHRTKPVVFTEIGRWMNAYLIDKEETMDSPSLFTEWAGIYANVMRGGGYGMWAFKFANTSSSTYPRGIKSGHHHTWKGFKWAEDAQDNLVLGMPVKASSCDRDSEPTAITDGDKTSGWRTEGDSVKWIEIDVGRILSTGGMVIYTGSSGGEFTAPDRIRDITVEAWDGSAWNVVAREENTRYAQLFYRFSPAVEMSRLRISTADKGRTTIREVKVFPAGAFDRMPESYDITGVQRTAEVVRLFAKGFKDSRPLYGLRADVTDPDVDICVSTDTVAGIHYVWLVNRYKNDIPVRMDMGSLGVREAMRGVRETVSGSLYGEAVTEIAGTDGVFSLSLGARSVSLLTVPAVQAAAPAAVAADRMASVRGGKFASKPQQNTSPAIRLDSRNGENNSVTYVHFSLDGKTLRDAGRILLGIHAACAQGDVPMRFHVYAAGGAPWSERALCWNNAPHLAPGGREALVTGVGTDVSVAGQMTAGQNPEWHRLDVTDVVKRHGGDITFILIRELREPGDDYDKERVTLVSARETPFSPVLEIW